MSRIISHSYSQGHIWCRVITMSHTRNIRRVRVRCQNTERNLSHPSILTLPSSEPACLWQLRNRKGTKSSLEDSREGPPPSLPGANARCPCCLLAPHCAIFSTSKIWPPPPPDDYTRDPFPSCQGPPHVPHSKSVSPPVQTHVAPVVCSFLSAAFSAPKEGKYASCCLLWSSAEAIFLKSYKQNNQSNVILPRKQDLSSILFLSY